MLTTRNNRALWAGCVAILFSVCAVSVHADEVTLADGSRLVGRVVSMSDGKVQFETTFAGTLTIETAKVTAIRTDAPVNVSLSTGDQLVGVLATDAEGKQQLTQTTFGDVPVPVDQITAVWPKDTPEPQVAVTQEQHEQEMAAAQAAHEAEMTQVNVEHEKTVQELQEANAKLQDPWAFRVELGVLGKTGNTESLTMNGLAEAKRTTEKERLRFYLQGRYDSQNGTRSANEIMGGVHIEVDLNERWFIFGRVDAEYDEFENLDLRFTATVGPGYYWISRPDEELKTRAGIGYQHESFMDGTTRDQPIAELGVEYRKEVAPWLLFTHSTTYYPTFDDLGDYRIVMDNAGEIPLGDSKEWKVKLGVKNEYDGLPEDGVERLDTTYYCNFVLDMK